MKKVLLSVMVLSVITLVSMSTMADTIEKDKGYISVNESTTKEISPNQAEIAIGIETSDKSMQKASEENKNIANVVCANLKSLLGADDYIKTSSYNARPVYVNTKDNKRIIDKYVVSNTVTIKTKKIELVSTIIDNAIAHSATNVSNLQFSAVNYDDACNSTLAELTKKSYTQAATVANSIGNKIIGVKSINTSCNAENQPRLGYGMMMMKSAMDEVSAPTPIQSGKLKINVNVDASFYVN